ERPPVNLALAIDRSSSMRGPRLGQALAAAREVVARLDDRDRLTIVAFDGSARLVFGPDRVTAEARRDVDAALAALDSGAGTNLAAGLRRAADALRAGYVRDAVSRLILLTDGQPSIGITDPDRLCQ